MKSADLLYGCNAIADFLGLTPRQAKYMAATGKIPTFKMGGRPCATKSGLKTFFEKEMDNAETSNRGGR